MYTECWALLPAFSHLESAQPSRFTAEEPEARAPGGGGWEGASGRLPSVGRPGCYARQCPEPDRPPATVTKLEGAAGAWPLTDCGQTAWAVDTPPPSGAGPAGARSTPEPRTRGSRGPVARLRACRLWPGRSRATPTQRSRELPALLGR